MKIFFTAVLTFAFLVLKYKKKYYRQFSEDYYATRRNQGYYPSFFTPTKWQTVLLHNYGLVPIGVLARALKTDEKTVEFEVKRLGVEEIYYNPKWKKQGYITVIKNNWHLLPYDQILTLLEMDEQMLDYNLREDDFGYGDDYEKL